MYTLIRSQSWNQPALEQAPPFLIAFTIAEFFYKFKSFTLECIAFLVTWFILDLIWQQFGSRGK